MNKGLLILAILALIGFNIQSTKPHRKRDNDALLYVNPWLFKALSGPTHNLIADKLWLMSNSVSEGRNYTDDINATAFMEASHAIVVMDPYFYKANNYATTFMTSILGKLKRSVDFLHLSQSFDKNNFLLYFNEMLYSMTYSKGPIDYRYIIKLAKIAAVLPDAQKVVGPIKVESWIDDILVYANSKLQHKKQALIDLEWLLEQTSDKKRRKEIQARINTLKSGSN